MSIISLLGGTNDCSFCAPGSAQLSVPQCQADHRICSSSNFVSLWTGTYCGGKGLVAAGQNGCHDCQRLRPVCATLCNWCSAGGTQAPTTTSTTTTTTSVNRGNHKKGHTVKCVIRT